MEAVSVTNVFFNRDLYSVRTLQMTVTHSGIGSNREVLLKRVEKKTTPEGSPFAIAKRTEFYRKSNKIAKIKEGK